MARRKSDLNALFDYNIDEASRTIFMGSHSNSDGEDHGVNFMMADSAIKALLYLDNKADEPIHIILNSPGGDEYHGMAIYDAIRSCRSSVSITVFGIAASMASIILQAGDIRYMAPNARIMIHYGSRYFDDHAKSVAAWNKEFDKMDLEMEQLYLDKIREVNPKYKLQDIKKLLLIDTILDAKQAIALGLADYIIGGDDER